MIFDETNVLYGDCVYAKVCNKKDSYLEIVKNFDIYKNNLDVDGVEATITEPLSPSAKAYTTSVSEVMKATLSSPVSESYPVNSVVSVDSISLYTSASAPM